ncbi:hypothetical protein ACFQZE_07695 [Paenibacillus sp. GCM10027627]|uniref:hypothetical protein n=1 Tax=unclassified Paenibacillus TaxID=185978 RepID=UPI00362A5173
MTGCIEEHVPKSYYMTACCSTNLCGTKVLPDGSVQNLYTLFGDIWYYVGNTGGGQNHGTFAECVCTGA